MEVGAVKFIGEFDSSLAEQQIEQFRKKLETIKIDIPASAIGSITNNVKKLNSAVIVPKVDHKPLTDLNKHIDLKVAHVKKANAYFKNNPLKVAYEEKSREKQSGKQGATSVKQTERIIVIKDNKQELVLLSNIFKSLSSLLSNYQKTVKETNSFLKNILQVNSKGVTDSNNNLSTINKSTKANKPNIIQQTIANTVGNNLATISDSFFIGIRKGIEKNFNFDFDVIGEQFTNISIAYGKGAKELLNQFKKIILELPEVSAFFENIQAKVKPYIEEIASYAEDLGVALAEEFSNEIAKIIAVFEKLDFSKISKLFAKTEQSNKKVKEEKITGSGTDADKRKNIVKEIKKINKEISEALLSASNIQKEYQKIKATFRKEVQEAQKLKASIATDASNRIADAGGKDTAEGQRIILEAGTKLQSIDEAIAKETEDIELKVKILLEDKIEQQNIIATKQAESDNLIKLLSQQNQSVTASDDFKTILSVLLKGKNVDPDALPNVEAKQLTGKKKGEYSKPLNTIFLSPELFAKLASNVALTKKEIETVVRELSKGIDSAFGTFDSNVIESMKLVPETEEEQNIVREARASVSATEKVRTTEGYVSAKDEEANVALNTSRKSKEVVAQKNAQGFEASFKKQTKLIEKQVKDVSQLIKELNQLNLNAVNNGFNEFDSTVKEIQDLVVQQIESINTSQKELSRLTEVLSFDDLSAEDLAKNTASLEKLQVQLVAQQQRLQQLGKIAKKQGEAMYKTGNAFIEPPVALSGKATVLKESVTAEKESIVEDLKTGIAGKDQQEIVAKEIDEVNNFFDSLSASIAIMEAKLKKVVDPAQFEAISKALDDLTSLITNNVEVFYKSLEFKIKDLQNIGVIFPTQTQEIEDGFASTLADLNKLIKSSKLNKSSKDLINGIVNTIESAKAKITEQQTIAQDKTPEAQDEAFQKQKGIDADVISIESQVKGLIANINKTQLTDLGQLESQLQTYLNSGLIIKEFFERFNKDLETNLDNKTADEQQIAKNNVVKTITAFTELNKKIRLFMALLKKPDITVDEIVLREKLAEEIQTDEQIFKQQMAETVSSGPNKVQSIPFHEYGFDEILTKGDAQYQQLIKAINQLLTVTYNPQGEQSDVNKQVVSFQREVQRLGTQLGSILDNFTSSGETREALQVLGLDDMPNDEKVLKQVYRQRSKETHPDLGGSIEESEAVNKAYKTIQKEMQRGTKVPQFTKAVETQLVSLFEQLNQVAQQVATIQQTIPQEPVAVPQTVETPTQEVSVQEEVVEEVVDPKIAHREQLKGIKEVTKKQIEALTQVVAKVKVQIDTIENPEQQEKAIIDLARGIELIQKARQTTDEVFSLGDLAIEQQDDPTATLGKVEDAVTAQLKNLFNIKRILTGLVDLSNLKKVAENQLQEVQQALKETTELIANVNSPTQKQGFTSEIGQAVKSFQSIESQLNNLISATNDAQSIEDEGDRAKVLDLVEKGIDEQITRIKQFGRLIKEVQDKVKAIPTKETAPQQFAETLQRGQGIYQEERKGIESEIAKAKNRLDDTPSTLDNLQAKTEGIANIEKANQALESISANINNIIAEGEKAIASPDANNDTFAAIEKMLLAELAKLKKIQKITGAILPNQKADAKFGLKQGENIAQAKLAEVTELIKEVTSALPDLDADKRSSAETDIAKAIGLVQKASTDINNIVDLGLDSIENSPNADLSPLATLLGKQIVLLTNIGNIIRKIIVDTKKEEKIEAGTWTEEVEIKEAKPVEDRLTSDEVKIKESDTQVSRSPVKTGIDIGSQVSQAMESVAEVAIVIDETMSSMGDELTQIGQIIDQVFTSQGVTRIIKLANVFLKANLPVGTKKDTNIQAIVGSNQLGNIMSLIEGQIQDEGRPLIIPDTSAEGKTKYRRAGEETGETLPTIKDDFITETIKESFGGLKENLTQLNTDFNQVNLEAFIANINKAVVSLQKLELRFGLTTKQSKRIQGLKSYGTQMQSEATKIAETMPVGEAPIDISSLKPLKHGENYVEGIIEGVENKEPQLVKAVVGLAKIDAFLAEALEIKSPSKKGFKLGAWYVGGLINGVKSRAKDLDRTIKDTVVNVFFNQKIEPPTIPVPQVKRQQPVNTPEKQIEDFSLDPIVAKEGIIETMSINIQQSKQEITDLVARQKGVDAQFLWSEDPEQKALHQRLTKAIQQEIKAKQASIQSYGRQRKAEELELAQMKKELAERQTKATTKPPELSPNALQAIQNVTEDDIQRLLSQSSAVQLPIPQDAWDAIANIDLSPMIDLWHEDISTIADEIKEVVENVNNIELPNIKLLPPATESLDDLIAQDLANMTADLESIIGIVNKPIETGLAIDTAQAIRDINKFVQQTTKAVKKGVKSVVDQKQPYPIRVSLDIPDNAWDDIENIDLSEIEEEIDDVTSNINGLNTKAKTGESNIGDGVAVNETSSSSVGNDFEENIKRIIDDINKKINQDTVKAFDNAFKNISQKSRAKLNIIDWITSGFNKGKNKIGDVFYNVINGVKTTWNTQGKGIVDNFITNITKGAGKLKDSVAFNFKTLFMSKQDREIERELRRTQQELNQYIDGELQDIEINRVIELSDDAKYVPDDIQGHEFNNGLFPSLDEDTEEIRQLLAEIQNIKKNLKEAKEEVDQVLADDINKQLDDLELNITLENIEDVRSQVKELTRDANIIAGIEVEEPRTLDDMLSGIKDKFGMVFGAITRLMGGLIVSKFLGGLFEKITDGAFEAALQVENLERQLSFATGKSGIAELQRVRKEAEAIGISFIQASEGLRQFSASTIGTSMNENSGEIVSQFQKAFATFGLTGEEQEGAFLALSQMASKGVVSMEELRQQLAERLPGAMGMAARAMGVTVPEFLKLVESGQVLSEDLLPALATQLENESALGLATSAKSTQAELTRLENNIFNIQAGVGQIQLVLAKLGLPVINQALKLITDSVVELTIFLISSTVVSIIALVSALKAVAGVSLLVSKALTIATVAVKAFFVSMLPMLPYVAVFIALGLAVKGVYTVFNAGSKEIKQATQQLENLAKEMDSIKNKKEELQDLPNIFARGMNAKNFNVNVENIGRANQASLELYQSSRGNNDIDLGGGVTVKDDYSAESLKAIQDRLTELRTVQQNLKLQIAVASDQGDAKFLESLNKSKAEVEKEIQRIQKESFLDSAAIAQGVQAQQAIIDLINKQLVELQVTRGNYTEKEFQSMSNTYNMLLQDAEARLADLNKREEQRQTAIKAQNDLYTKQIASLRILQQTLANIEYKAGLESIDSQIGVLTKKLSGPMPDYQFDTEMRQVRMVEIETKFTVSAQAFKDYESDVISHLGKISDKTKQSIADFLKIDNVDSAILNKQISPETLAKLTSEQAPVALKEAIEQEPELKAMVEKGQEYLRTWQQIKQQQLESVNLIKEQQDALKQRIEDLRGFARSLEDLDVAVRDYLKSQTRAKEDLDVAVRDYKTQKVRGLEDFIRQVEDASLQYRRQQRDLIESYQDMNRQMLLQTAQVRRSIDETTRDIQKRSILNELRSNLKLGGQGLFGTFYDAIDQFFQTINDTQNEQGTLEEQRLQLQEDVIAIAKQIRGLQEQLYDMERQRILQVRDLLRQHIDYIRGQLDAHRNITRQLVDFVDSNKDALRAITRQFEDMETQARSMGVKFSNIFKAFDGINTNYSALNGAISGLIGTVKGLRSQAQKDLANSRANPNIPTIPKGTTPKPTATPSKPQNTTSQKPSNNYAQQALTALRSGLISANQGRARQLLENIPASNVSRTREQQANDRHIRKLIEEEIKKGNIVVNVNHKGEIKSVEAKTTQSTNLLATGNINSTQFKQPGTFVYNSKIGLQLGTLLNNIKTWFSTPPRPSASTNKTPYGNNNPNNPYPYGTHNRNTRNPYSNRLENKQSFNPFQDFDPMRYLMASAGMGDLSEGLVVPIRFELAQVPVFKPIIDVPTVDPNQIKGQQDINNLLGVEGDLRDKINVNQLQQNGNQLIQLKYKEFGLKQTQMELKVTEQYRQAENGLVNAMRSQSDALRQQLETWHNINKEVNQLVLNSKGYLLPTEQVSLALVDVNEKYRTQRKTITDFQRELQWLTDQVGDPNQLGADAVNKIINSPIFKSLPEDLQQQLSGLVDQYGNVVVDGYNQIQNILSQLPNKLDELNQAQPIELEIVAEITQLNIDIQALNNLSKVVNEMLEGTAIYDISRNSDLQKLVKQIEIETKESEMDLFFKTELPKAQQTLTDSSATDNDIQNAKNLIVLEKEYQAEREKRKNAITAKVNFEIDTNAAVNLMRRESEILKGFAEKQKEMNPFGGGTQIFAKAEELDILSRYREQLLKIKEMELSGEYTPQFINQLRKQLDEITNFDLSKIEEKFSIFAQAIREPMQQAFSSLFTDVIRGTKTITDVLNEFLTQVANFFANLAAQVITNQAMGWFKQLGLFAIGGLGGSNVAGSIGSNIGNSASTFLGGANMIASGVTIQGFDDGGTVQRMASLAKDGEILNLGLAVSKALAEEGAGGIPIVAHLGEQILTDRNGDAQLFRQLQQNGEWDRIKYNFKYQGDFIPNYKDGGPVGKIATPMKNTPQRNNPQGVVYNYAINVTTKDADSFRKSKSLIAQEQKLMQERNNRFN